MVDKYIDTSCKMATPETQAKARLYGPSTLDNEVVTTEVSQSILVVDWSDESTCSFNQATRIHSLCALGSLMDNVSDIIQPHFTKSIQELPPWGTWLRLVGLHQLPGQLLRLVHVRAEIVFWQFKELSKLSNDFWLPWQCFLDEMDVTCIESKWYFGMTLSSRAKGVSHTVQSTVYCQRDLTWPTLCLGLLEL